MALTESVEHVPGQFDESLRLAQGVDFVPVGDDGWRKHFSATGQYGPEDRFDEDIFTQIEQRLETATVRLLLRVSISAIAILAVFVALYFLFFDRGDLWRIDFSGPREIVLSATAVWLSLTKLTTGVKVVLSGFALTIVTLVASITLSAKLFSESREYLRWIRDLRKKTNDARQIFPGSGDLQFSYGEKGILALANTMSMKISWHRVADPDGLMFLLVARRKVGAKRRNSVRFDVITNDMSAVTHLLLFLNASDGSEYLVIPKRFFQDGMNATKWAEFVDGLTTYRSQFGKT